MSFKYSPTCLRFPAIPNIEFASGFWIGDGADVGLVAYQLEFYTFGHAVITERRFAYDLVINGETYNPIMTDINGYCYWKGSKYCFYYSLKYGWVLCDKFPGYEPVESYNSTTERYEGDSFYVAASLPSNESASVSLTPRGLLNGRASISLKISFPRWENTIWQELGEYQGVSGCTGSKFLGLPRWRSSTGAYYVRSVVKDSTGHFTYGAVHYASGKWLIGNAGSESGWHEGSEPTKEGTTTFTFCKPEGSQITGKNISLAFYDYVIGDNQTAGYIGELALWR